MKKTGLLLLVPFLCGLAFGQEARECKVEYGRQDFDGYAVEIPGETAGMTEAAFKNMMEKGYALKSGRKKGFKVYGDCAFLPFGNGRYDIYAKVSAPSRRSRPNVTLVMIVCSDSGKAVSSSTDPARAARIRSFMKDFVPYVHEYSVRIETDVLNAEIAKLEKRRRDLQKAHARLTRQLDGNRKDFEATEKAIREAQSKIDVLQSAQ